jgi:hypothetical protein
MEQEADSRKTKEPLAIIALAASVLGVILPVCSPVGVVCACLALVQSKTPLGKALALAALVLGVGATWLPIGGVLGLLGLEGATLCCSAWLSAQ